MLSANQCRMARAALGLGIRDLAHLADVSPNTVARLERGENLHPRTLEYLQGAFEAEGVTFLSIGNVSAWGGEGVRMAGSATSNSRMAVLFRAFRELPDLRSKPENAYFALLDIFAHIIAMMRLDNRVPDAWERISLRNAVVVLNDQTSFRRPHCFGRQSHPRTTKHLTIRSRRKSLRRLRNAMSPSSTRAWRASATVGTLSAGNKLHHPCPRLGRLGVGAEHAEEFAAEVISLPARSAVVRSAQESGREADSLD